MEPVEKYIEIENPEDWLFPDRTDIRYIQELLGHSSPETTEIYTHVSKNSIRKIRGPLDDIF